jgi:EamA-like transporter family
MSRYPASTVAPFTLLVPVVGILTAWLVRGEHPTWGELLGSLVALVGLGPGWDSACCDDAFAMLLLIALHAPERYDEAVVRSARPPPPRDPLRAERGDVDIVLGSLAALPARPSEAIDELGPTLCGVPARARQRGPREAFRRAAWTSHGLSVKRGLR